MPATFSEGMMYMGKKQAEVYFSKSQFVNSEQCSPADKDVLNALLEEDKRYTAAEVNKLVEQFTTKEVV
jgi:hypothetical protein